MTDCKTIQDLKELKYNFTEESREGRAEGGEGSCYETSIERLRFIACPLKRSTKLTDNTVTPLCVCRFGPVVKP